MLSIWNIVQEKYRNNYKIFDIVLEEKVNTSTKEKYDFVKIDSANWVNIIPITNDNKVVLIKQFRHGTDEIVLEIPGGMVDNGEKFIDSAKRECIEETGFKSDTEPILLGEFLPNPAFQNNRLYSYVWQNCEFAGKTNFDNHEEIITELYTFDEVDELIKMGKLNHSLVLNAFYLLEKKNIL